MGMCPLPRAADSRSHEEERQISIVATGRFSWHKVRGKLLVQDAFKLLTWTRKPVGGWDVTVLDTNNRSVLTITGEVQDRATAKFDEKGWLR